jgi:hypothetical protein
MLVDSHDYENCRKYNCEQCLELQNIMFGDDFYDLHDREQTPVTIEGPAKWWEQEKNNIGQFLGNEKYLPILDSIYVGLGIPIEIQESVQRG